MLILNKHPEKYIADKIESGDEVYVNHLKAFQVFSDKLAEKLESFQLHVQIQDEEEDRDETRHLYLVIPRKFENPGLDKPMKIRTTMELDDDGGKEKLVTRVYIETNFFKEREHFNPLTNRFEMTYEFHIDKVRVYTIDKPETFLERLEGILTQDLFIPYRYMVTEHTPKFIMTKRVIEAIKEKNVNCPDEIECYTPHNFLRYFDDSMLKTIGSIVLNDGCMAFEFVIDLSEEPEKYFVIAIVERNKNQLIGQFRCHFDDYMDPTPPNPSSRFIHLRLQVETVFEKVFDLKDPEVQKNFIDIIGAFWEERFIRNKLNFSDDNTRLITRFEGNDIVVEYIVNGFFETKTMLRKPIKPDDSFLPVLFSVQEIIWRILTHTRLVDTHHLQLQRIDEHYDGVYFTWPVGDMIRIHEKDAVGEITYKNNGTYLIVLYPYVEGQSRYLITAEKEKIRTFFKELVERKRSVNRALWAFPIYKTVKESTVDPVTVTEARAYFDAVLVKERTNDITKAKWMNFEEFIKFAQNSEITPW